MMPYVHILLSDLKTWFFCQLYMFCGRGAVVSFGPPQAENFWENPGFFTQPQAKTILFFWGVKMVPYIHIFYTACRRRKTFCFFLGQNGAIYITYTFFTQPAAGEKIRGFWGSKWCHIYTFWGSKWCYIYTFWIFFGEKMLPSCTNFVVWFENVIFLPAIHVLW